MQHAHELDLPPPASTGSSTSTAPRRRGVEPLAPERVLPYPALPPLPRARARFCGWAMHPRLLDRPGLYRTISNHPLAVGVIILQSTGGFRQKMVERIMRRGDIDWGIEIDVACEVKAIEGDVGAGSSAAQSRANDRSDGGYATVQDEIAKD